MKINNSKSNQNLKQAASIDEHASSISLSLPDNSVSSPSKFGRLGQYSSGHAQSPFGPNMESFRSNGSLLRSPGDSKYLQEYRRQATLKMMQRTSQEVRKIEALNNSINTSIASFGTSRSIVGMQPRVQSYGPSVVSNSNRPSNMGRVPSLLNPNAKTQNTSQVVLQIVDEDEHENGIRGMYADQGASVNSRPTMSIFGPKSTDQYSIIRSEVRQSAITKKTHKTTSTLDQYNSQIILNPYEKIFKLR